MAHLNGIKIHIVYLIKIIKLEKNKFKDIKKKNKKMIEKFKTLFE